MPEPTEIEKLSLRLERLLDEMVAQQRRKAWALANRIQPGLSEDDLRDPHSFPAVSSRPEFAFEDGIVAGLVAAQVAIIRETMEFAREASPDNR